jgi:hypothetical protein
MNINSNLSGWIADFQIDDLSDWEHQAAQMSSLYKNAFFTIANTMGTSVHDNIRLRTPPHEWVEVPWTFGPDPSMQGSFIVDANQNDLGIHNFDEDVKNSVWGSRGWTFQEALLSQRTLYLGKSGAYWECQSGLVARLEEDFMVYHPLHDPLRSAQLSNEPQNAFKRFVLTDEEPYWPALAFRSTLREINDLWIRLLELYCARKLTYKSDTLVALSGLAKNMVTLIKKVDPGVEPEYFGGVWKDGLLWSLLWYTQVNRTTLSSKVHMRKRESLEESYLVLLGCGAQILIRRSGSIRTGSGR